MNMAMPWPSITILGLPYAKQIGERTSIIAAVAFFFADPFTRYSSTTVPLGNVL